MRPAGDRGSDAVTDASFAIRSGEILGVAGVAGNGQRELAEAVTGLRPVKAGTIRVEDVPLSTGAGYRAALCDFWDSVR